MSLNQSKCCDPKEKLTTVTRSLTIANKALQDVIRSKDDGMRRLAQFEHQFESFQEKYKQFRKLAGEHEEQTNDLLLRIQEENERDRRIKENLESAIARLYKDIETLTSQNDRLEKVYKDNVDKLRELSTEQNVVPSHMKSNPSPFIQRLLAEDPK